MNTPCIEEKIHARQSYPRKRDANGKLRPTHRINWIERYGPIPDGFVLHHVCENKACVNPDHLLMVHNDDHFYVFHHRVCKNGLHAMDEGNVVWWGNHRRCKACIRDMERRKKESLFSDPQRLAHRRAYRVAWMRRQREAGAS